MTFKEFVSWCNDRACDGCWGMLDAIVCADIISEIRNLAFWRRKKRWNEIEHQVLEEIVSPINARIILSEISETNGGI